MKLKELQANTEYAVIRGRWRNSKIMITPEQLARGLSKRYGYTGQLDVQVCEPFRGEERWHAMSVPISQIKMLWSDFLIQQAAEKKAREEEEARNALIRKENEAKQDELWQFIQQNKERMRSVSLISDKQYLSPYDCRGGRINISFNKDSLEYLINKLEN
jgi:hypothetical protein